MPIVNTKSNRVVAVVQLLNKQGGAAFDAQDEQRFREFADSIGIILESCNSFYLAARNQRGVTALLKATACLGQSLDLDKTLQVVMEEARHLMQADRSTLFLVDHAKEELWSKVARADKHTTMEIRIPANRGIAGYVASTGQTLNIPNAYEDPRFDCNVDKQTGYRTRNILCMPVYNSEGLLIGVTQLINKAQGSFTSSDEEFMRAFNIQAGIALENAQLFERVLLERQYQKDILQSLSDAVISTDLQGKIVTINDAALQLLGCSADTVTDRSQAETWRQALIGCYVWDVLAIDNLQLRLEDSLTHGARHYVPEQSLVVREPAIGWHGAESANETPTADQTGNPAEPPPNAPSTTMLPAASFERSINLTVNPLTNPEGSVRGGLVVLEDISQEKRMKATLYRYMTPGVAERVMALGEDALMVGERKDVTILFSDIRSYTSLTERMSAAEVVSLLNNYFEAMVEAVFNFDGTLDKFIGDALMAVFGAPLPLDNHAWMAVQSALDMRRRLKDFNQQRQASGQSLIHIGIGLSSGEVVSGNIGSQKRMDYTVIGDGVDISSRLESATKEYGCDIILSEFTYSLCAERIWTRQLDRVRVKGKTRPIDIYELIDDRQHSLDQSTQDFLDLYQAGRQAYTSCQFQHAIDLFTRAQQLRTDDRATALFIKRSRHYLHHPPSGVWDGVYAMMSK
jgi:adenylate cyclase